MSELHIPTLKDVARAAGVHAATASRALSEDQAHQVNDATRLRVRTAAEALGYRTNTVAQSLRRGTTGVLGVIVADLANPFIIAVLRGIGFECQRRDYMPLVAETHDDPQVLRGVLTRLLGNRVDGIILSAARTGDEQLVADLEQRVPVVLSVRGFGVPREDDAGAHLEVLQDDVLGARSAVGHLLSLGHHRIAQIPGDPNISSFAGRSQGYLAAMAQHPDVQDVSTGAYALETTLTEGRRLAGTLLRLPPDRRPTAIFAHNDLMAVGTIDAMRDVGLRCPDDVSVVGYNDAPLSDHTDPPLTTVRLPGFELGRHSAQMAFRSLAGDKSQEPRIMLAPEFVERRSTRPPPPS